MTVDTTKLAPWSADSEVLRGSSLSHTATAEVVLPDGNRVGLDLEGGRVTFDETRSPRVTASLTCRVPADQSVLDSLDPRTGARVAISAGYRRPDGLTDEQPLCDLGLRSRVVSRPDDRLTLECAGDESLVIDNAGGTGGSVVETNTVNGIITTIRLIFPGVAVDTTGTTPGPALSQSPMGDKWDLILDLADRVGAQVYDNGLRGWFVRPAPAISTPAVELRVGAGGTLTGSATTLSREAGFANRVLITYDWTTGSTRTVLTGVRSINSGPYAATTGNVRLLEVDREIPTTAAEATAAAASMVARTVTRGRGFALTGVSAYWLRPGHTATVQLPIGGPENHLVVAVDFDLSSGLMSVATRLPDGNYTIGA